MKKVLIIIIAMVVAILGYAAVSPKDFKIEKSITINKPVAEVFSYLRLIKNSESWQPWTRIDPEMKKEFKGVDGTVGAISSWSGNSQVGIGEEEIKAISENQRIDFELRFVKPLQTTNTAFLSTEEISANETKVTWSMSGNTPFPFNLICIMMHETVEKNFEQGLNNLKTILEKSPEEAAQEVKTDATAEFKTEEEVKK